MSLFSRESLEYLSEILKILKDKEFKRLKKCLPNWQEDKKKKIIRILNTTYSNLEMPLEIRWEKVAKLFEVKTEKSISNYINILIKEVEQFIIRLETENKVILKTDLLTDFAKRRNNNFVFKKNRDKQRRLLLKTPDSFYKSFLQFKANHKTYFHTFTNKYDVKSETLLNNSLEGLNDFYLMTRLQLACEIISRKKAVGSNIELIITKEELETIKSRINHNETIKIYHNVYLILLGEYNIPIEEVMPFYKKSASIISIAQQEELLDSLINYTNTLINIDEQQTYKLIAHALHKFRLSPKLLAHNPIIEAPLFIAIIQVALSLDSKNVKVTDRPYLNWTKDFIEKNEQYLNDKNREEIIDFSNALVDLYSENWDEAIIKFSDFYLGADDYITKLHLLSYKAKAIVGKEFITNLDKTIWYTKDLKEVCKNIKKIATKNIQGEETQLIFMNFTDYLRRIITTKNIKYDKLKAEIQSVEHIASKNWLVYLCEIFEARFNKS